MEIMSSFREELLREAARYRQSNRSKGSAPKEVIPSNPTMVETEFGDMMPAPEAQTRVPKVEQPDRRTQIRQEIEAQQNSIDSVYRANVGRWREEKAAADRWPVFGVGRMGVPLSRVDTRPEAQKQLAAAATELKRAKAASETYTEAEQQQDETKGQGKSWLGQLWQGATNLSPDKAVDILTAGMASTVIDSRINPILEKASRGEALTEYERAVVAARGATQNAQQHVADQGGATTAYAIGESLPGTAQFMIETAGTGGSVGVGKALVGGAWKAVGKAAAKEAVRTPFRGSMWQDLEERTGYQYFVQNDGTVDKEESSAAARLYKSYMSTFAEGFSEQLGNVVGGGLLAKGAEKVAPKLLGQRVGGALVGGVERLAKATEGVRDVFRRTTNYNGTFDEFGEELVNNIIEPILTCEPERIKENFSSKNLLTTLGSVALVGSAMHAAELPSVARHYAQDGKLRKQTNQAVAAIGNEALRQGVFDALKKGQTVEQKAAQLSALDWGNVSPEDAAHVVDAFSANLRHELFKGVDQEQTTQEVYAHQYALFNAEYGQIAHRDTGAVQELLDDEGNDYYLLSGSLDDSSADNTVFVYNAQTGRNEQLDRNRIAYVEPAKTYGQLLDGFNQQTGASLVEQIETEPDEDPDTDATEAGVSPVTYAQGEVVELSDGRSGEFIGYMPDGATVRVALLDEQTGEPNTVEVHCNQIVGLADVAPVVVAPTTEQEVVATNQTPVVPLQPDGTPGYDAMNAAQFLEEYGKVYSPEEAVSELEGERTLLGKQIDKLKKGSPSLARNTREKNRRKIADLQIRLDDITSVIGEKAAPVAVAQAPSVEARMDDAPKRLSISGQLDGYGDPVSLRDYILREIAQGKRFRWKDEGASRGLASELGFVGKESERRARIGLLKKEGDTPERYAEHLTAEVAPKFGMTEYNEVRDEVIDVLLSVNSKGQAFVQLKELHDNRPEQIEVERAEYVQGQADKEAYDAQAEMEQNYDHLSPEDFPKIDALFAEESLSLYRNDNTERIPQHPTTRASEATGYSYDGGNDIVQTEGDHGEGSAARTDRRGDLRPRATGSVGSGGSRSAVESTQQSDGIEQPAAADLSQVRFSESNGNYTPEMERIKSDAIERGDFMRAPNGNSTHLTERQWLQVRTAPFKEWFGDWEKSARIEKLRTAEPVRITGEEITPSDDLRQYKRNALEYGKSLRGAYVNEDTGQEIELGRGAVQEVLQHDYKNVEQLQSVAAIPQIIERSTYITTVANEDKQKRPDIVSYDYYVCGLNMGGADYTVRAVVATQTNGQRYYDHKLSAIEKGKLIEKLAPYSTLAPSELSSTTESEGSKRVRPAAKSRETYKIPSVSDVKDTKLVTILQTDVSKVVDANGEPMVVYHGTNAEFNAFSDIARLGQDEGIYFTSCSDVAQTYAGEGNVLSVFLNLRNPKIVDSKGTSFNSLYDDHFFAHKLIEAHGNDGVVFENIYDHPSGKRKGKKASTIIAFESDQIKSATDNTGEFSLETNDIRYRERQWAAEQTYDEIQRQQGYEAKKAQMPPTEAERNAQINEVLQKLTREFGVETVQVDTAADLPAPLRAATKGRRFAGLYHKPSGAVYLIASELRDADHATATYLHEVVAHKGIDGLLGQERADRFYAAVFDALKPEEQARLLERYGSKAIAGDEVVARMAEGDVTPGTMQRVVAAVRRFFREVLGFDLTVSDTDIRYILFKSKISLQRTSNLTDAMRAIEADQRMRAAVALDELRAKERASADVINETFNNELSELENGALPKHHIFLLGYPSNPLTSAGVPTLPIELSSDRLLRKSEQKEHKFDLSTVKNLPQALANPIAVFDSKTRQGSKVVLTELSDGTKNFVVAIQTASLIQRGRNVIEVNDVKSLHPKDVDKIAYWVNGGLMRWVDKEKALNFFATQWPNYIGGSKMVESLALPAREDTEVSLQGSEPSSIQWPNYIADGGTASGAPVASTQAKAFATNIVQNFENPTAETRMSEKIEPIEDRLNLDRKPQSGNLDSSTNSISATNLLKGVEKSNKEGKLVSENAEIRLSETTKSPNSIPHRVVGDKKLKRSIAGAKQAIGSYATQLQEGLQDATIKVHLLQKEVQQGGGAITPWTNPYEAMNHVDSRANAAMRKYERRFMNPIVGHIKRWRKAYGLEYDKVTDYLLAKHSLERHASGINALDEKEGGKWTKEHATTQVEAVESVVPEAELAALWADWRKATHEVLEIGVHSGRMSLDEKREILGNGWQYYVPLRGKDFDFEQVADMRDVFYYEMNRGQGGTSVSDRIADIKAKGRSSKSGDPIAMLQYMANNEIYLSEQNNARRALLRLVEAHPERTDLFSVRQKWYVKSPDGLWAETDQTPDAEKIRTSTEARKALRTEKDPKKREELKDKITVSLRERDAGKAYTGAPKGAHSVSVMKDGIRYTVELVDPEVAAAFNRKTNGWQSALSNTIGRPTRVMAQLNTSKNPAFILPNFVRDMQQGALYNFVDSEGNVKGFMNHALGSWKVLHRAFLDTANPLTAAEIGLRDITSIEGQAELRELYGKDRVNDTLYEMFADNGGETGYVHIADPKDYERKLRKEIQTAAGGGWTRKTVKGLNAGLDYVAAMSENAVRYATFVSQLETGKTVFDAVVYAKNITVNFNRKGKYAKGIGALFMFFNAGIQGLDNQLSLIDNRQGKDKKTIRKQRARFVAAKAVQTAVGYFSSYLLRQALAALMGDDGEEYTVSDYERRTNFIIPIGGKYIKIPIAIPDRPFYALGVMVGDMVDGKMTAGEVTQEFASMFIDAYNPISSDFVDPDNGITHLKRLIPSALKPMFDLAFNQDFMGLPINKKKYDDMTPDSQLGLKKTAWWAKVIAKELNEWGGGNAATPAGVDVNGEKGILNWLDVSPGSIEHLLGSYSGGVGRIVSDIAALIGGDTEVRRMPIVDRFVGEPYEKRPSSDYYTLKGQIEFRDRNNRKTVANGEPSAIYSEEEFEQKAQADQQWRSRLQQSDKRIKKLREELDNAPDGSAQYDQLEQEIEHLQRQFIKDYNEQNND